MNMQRLDNLSLKERESLQAIANDFMPPLIENDHRCEYLDALADPVELERFLEKSIGKSMELIFK